MYSVCPPDHNMWPINSCLVSGYNIGYYIIYTLWCHVSTVSFIEHSPGGLAHQLPRSHSFWRSLFTHFPGSSRYFSGKQFAVYITLKCQSVFITARKRSLGQGNIFRSVCQEFCSQGWVCVVAGGGACVVAQGGMHGFMGCMHGCWGACVVAGGMHGCRGACVVVGGCVVTEGHAWLLGVCMVAGGGACVVARGVHGCWGACVVQGDMHGCRGHVWLPGGMHGCQRVAWLLGGCVIAGEHAWLLGGMCGCWGGMHGCRGCIEYDEIQSMSGQYASYWNAFLLLYAKTLRK